MMKLNKKRALLIRAFFVFESGAEKLGRSLWRGRKPWRFSRWSLPFLLLLPGRLTVRLEQETEMREQSILH